MRMSKLVLLLASTLLTLSALHTTAQAQDAVCAGLTGAAFGQCTAAVNVGCDGSATQPAGCTRIAKTFTRLSGQPAPWVIGKCSCYDNVAVRQQLTEWLAANSTYHGVWYEGPHHKALTGLEFGISIQPDDPNSQARPILNPMSATKWDAGFSADAGQCEIRRTVFGLPTLDEVASCRAILSAVAEELSLPEARASQ